MTARTPMFHVRVNNNSKGQATQALTTMGLSLSDAVRLFLRRMMIGQACPLEFKVSKVQTRDAMNESRAKMANRRARFASSNLLFADLEKNSGQ